MYIRNTLFAIAALFAAIASGAAPASAGKAIVVVTIDDSPKSAYALAFPKMQELGLVGTLFLVPGCHGKDPWCLKWDQAKTMAGGGWEMASHAYEHVKLTKISATRLEASLRDSAAAIKKYTGQWPVSFAVPFCETNTKVDAAVLGWYDNNILECGGETDGFNPIVGFDRTKISRFEVTWKMTVNEACAAIDTAVSSESVLVLLFHDITRGKVEEYQMSKATFDGVMDCLAAARDAGKVEVKTLRAVVAAIVGKECDCAE